MRTPQTLDLWLERLEQLHPVGIDLGLERIGRVADAMGLERPAKCVITVAGTNGKGSTVAMLEAILRAAGLHVGVYTSPHFLRYNERVRIDGQEIADQPLCDAFAAIDAARGDTSLTYFEFGTLAAFRLFEDAALDVAILEVGLGGRLDAVNLVDPDIAIVTSIGLDHQEWLGSDLEQIGREKAGIYRRGKPALFSSPERPSSIARVALDIGAHPYWYGSQFSVQRHDVHFNWQGVDRHQEPVRIDELPLPRLPLANVGAVLEAVELLPWTIERAAIVQGLMHATLPGRYQKRTVHNGRGEAIELVLDVAHNPHAATFLATNLAQDPCAGQTLAVFSILRDKDAAGVVKALAGEVGDWVYAPLDCPRATPVAELDALLRQQGASASPAPTVAAALERALDLARAGDRILVLGSFYTVAAAIDWLADH